jgi:hypothetical protein
MPKGHSFLSRAFVGYGTVNPLLTCVNCFTRVFFDKNLVFDSRSIRDEKDPVKKINWVKGKGKEGVL